MRNSSIRSVAAKVTSAVTVAALSFPAFAMAQSGALDALRNGVDATGDAAELGAKQSLPELVGNLVQQAMGLLGIVLVVLVIYAGFLWMTAQGNEEKIKKAKGIITSAVIGLVLIFAAYSITDFVVVALTEAGQ